MFVLFRVRIVLSTAFLALLVNLGVVNGQVDENFWSYHTYLDVNNNTVLGMRFQSTSSQTPNLNVETVFSNSLILINVCANVPQPSTVTDVSYDWNHIETLAIVSTSTVNGIKLNGGHFGSGSFPATLSLNGKTYTLTYTKIPANPLPDKPYEVVAEVKLNGMIVPVERPRWTMFPENWTQTQMRSVVMRA